MLKRSELLTSFQNFPEFYFSFSEPIFGLVTAKINHFHSFNGAYYYY